MSSPAAVRAYSLGHPTSWVNVWDYFQAGDTFPTFDAALMFARAIADGLATYPNGFMLYAPAAVYPLISGGIVLRSGVWLIGDGRNATILQPQAGFTGDVISTPIPSVEGASGYIQQYCGVSGLHVDCSLMSGTFTQGRGNAVHYYGTRYCWVLDCLFTSMPNLAILLDGDNASPGQNFGYNNLVRGNIFDLGAAGIYCNASEANDIVENQFKQANATMASAQPYWSDTNPAPSTTGRHLTCTTGYQYVAGNVLGKSGSYTSEAILITNAGTCRVIGNRFDNVRNQAVHTWSGGHIIVGNTFDNCGSAGSGVPTLDMGSAANLIANNVWASGNSNNYAVRENGAYSPGQLIIGNRLLAGTAGTLSLNAATQSSVRGNLGYNPVGYLSSQPAVPASGTAYTNVSGVDCTVYVAGGTVTAISVGGTATGVTSGAVRVPAGSTITLTYSAAPTWKWFGE